LILLPSTTTSDFIFNQKITIDQYINSTSCRLIASLHIHNNNTTPTTIELSMDSLRDRDLAAKQEALNEAQQQLSRTTSGTGDDSNTTGDGNTTSHTNQRPKSSRLTHSVSIFVEPCLDDDTHSPDDPLDPNSTSLPMPDLGMMPRRHSAGPILLVEESDNLGTEFKKEEREFVESIMAHARLRKEEFARLLEEHAQIVSEINRAETKLL